MPSFDIVSQVDPQTLDNAVNTAKKEILNRFDFRDSKSSIELDKKELSIQVITENEMRLRQIMDVIISRMTHISIAMEAYSRTSHCKAEESSGLSSKVMTESKLLDFSKSSDSIVT